MSKLIIFAVLQEAETFLHSIHAIQETSSLYRFHGGLCAISGMGIHAAQMAAALYAPYVEEIWNIGYAGALQPNLTHLEIVSVATLGKYLPVTEQEIDAHSYSLSQTLIPPLYLGNEGISLISSDFPIHSSLHRDRLHAWDAVDMEAYGIGYVTSHLGKKCRIWKIISDFASPEGRSLIHAHSEILSQRIAQHLEESLCQKP